MKKIAILSTLALAACVVTPDTDGGGLAFADRSDAPELAMMEFILAEYFTSDITDPPTVCAAVHDGQALRSMSAEEETALISRFAQLAPFSRCTMTSEGWMDNATDEPALVFTLYRFACSADEACSGWANYNTQGNQSVSQRYVADWRDGAWRFSVDPGIVAE